MKCLCEPLGEINLRLTAEQNTASDRKLHAQRAAERRRRSTKSETVTCREQERAHREYVPLTEGMKQQKL